MNVRRPLREYVFEHSISHDQLTALGRIVVEAAQLEDAVEWAIWGAAWTQGPHRSLVHNTPEHGGQGQDAHPDTSCADRAAPIRFLPK